MIMEKSNINHWSEKLEKFELYGTAIDIGLVIRNKKTINEIIPIFPYENQNHGLGSPLLTLLKNNDTT